MIRRQWISYLFAFAFAIALTHNVLPHAHPKEEGSNHKHQAAHSKSHSHSKDEHHHSHSKDSNQDLPVFTHFANADFTIAKKYSLNEKQQLVLEFEKAVVVSLAIPVAPSIFAPIPHARDLPNKVFLTSRLLRAPPVFLS